MATPNQPTEKYSTRVARDRFLKAVADHFPGVFEALRLEVLPSFSKLFRIRGQNLILNMNDHGYTVLAYNRTVSKVDEFLNDAAKGRSPIIGARSIEEVA